MPVRFQYSRPTSLGRWLILATILTGVGLGQDLHPALSPSQANAISALSKYFDTVSPRLDMLLLRTGFQAGAQINWRQRPTIRKIETAYLMADAGAPPPAEELLVVLAHELAKEYESVKDPLSPLNPYANRPPPQRRTFNYHTPVAGENALAWNPDNKTVSAINELAKYFEANALGGVQGAMLNYLHLPENVAYELLRTADTNAQALQLALSYVPERERKPRLAALISAVEEISESARAEGAFASFRSRTWPEIESRDYPSPQVLQGGRVEFDKVMQESYPTVTDRSFESMRKTRKGLGGVIFGNTVTSTLRHKGVRFIQWIGSSENKQFGRFLVQFSDGAQYSFGPTRTEDAAVATKIVFPDNGSSPPKPGEGIGLIGATGTRILQVDGAGVRTVGWRSKIAMHPILESTDLGWAGLIADSQPWNTSKFSSIIGTENAKILRATGWNPVHDARKITDVPPAIRSDGTRILVMRREMPGDHGDPAVARSAFITMEIIPSEGHTVGANFPDLFYTMVPALAQHSYNYDRLNKFAAVLGFVRWTRAEGAMLKGRPLMPALSATPPAVFHNSSGYKSIALFDGQKIIQEQCDRMASFYDAAVRPFNLESSKDSDYWMAWIKDACGPSYAASVERRANGLIR
jgi:hypothetical protein